MSHELPTSDRSVVIVTSSSWTWWYFNLRLGWDVIHVVYDQCIRSINNSINLFVQGFLLSLTNHAEYDHSRALTLFGGEMDDKGVVEVSPQIYALVWEDFIPDRY